MSHYLVAPGLGSVVTPGRPTSPLGFPQVDTVVRDADAIGSNVPRETGTGVSTEDVDPATGDDDEAEPRVHEEKPVSRGTASQEQTPRTTPSVLADLPTPTQTRILTVSNQKGGVGKTTTAVNIAAGLATRGLRVLVIDLDPQGNASTALGIDHRSEIDSVYDVLTDDLTLAQVVQSCPDIPGLTCAPATIDLAGAEIELVSLVAREMRLRRAISTYLEGLDEQERPHYVLIDCPPSLGLLTINAFVAADEVLIPIQCEYYALEGLSMLIKNIDLIKAHLNPGLHISTVLLTMYDRRTNLASQVADEVTGYFGDKVIATRVPRSVRISEAPSYGQTVVTYDPNGPGALSYLEAAREIAERGASGAF